MALIVHWEDLINKQIFQTKLLRFRGAVKILPLTLDFDVGLINAVGVARVLAQKLSGHTRYGGK
jgi:hypothetical protein